jgi:hypothetical protein
VYIAVPDLPLCLGVIKHKASLGPQLPVKAFLLWIFAYVVQFYI